MVDDWADYFSLLLLVPVFYWMRMSAYKEELIEPRENSFSERSVLIILPMKNEISNVKRKLLSVIDEIQPTNTWT